MTNAIAKLAAAADELKHIAWDEIQTAPWNARKTFDKAASEELVRSIEQHGIQVPLIVRPLRRDGFFYEIVAGHRRFNAAAALDMPTVPCVVRELGDREAQEIGLVDNLQREELPALEEADGFRALREQLGTDAAVAFAVGKEISYVTKRLQLCVLGASCRAALAERLITVDHALLLARLGAEEQDANLKWALDPAAGVKKPLDEVMEAAKKSRERKDAWRYWEPQSVLELKRHIEQNVGRRLSLAPWDLDDEHMSESAPACSKCPSNTRANDSLFGDLNLAEATCENGVCFEEKRATFVHIRLAAANEKQLAAARAADSTERGAGVALRLSWKPTASEPRKTKEGGIKVDQIFRQGQWIQAKPKSCAHVRLGVTVDWSEDGHHGFEPALKGRKPGEILHVCIEPGCKMHPKRYAKQPGAKGDGHGSNAGESYEERQKREQEEAQKFAAAEEPVRRALYDAIVAKLTPAGMLRAVLGNGSHESVLLARGIEIENWQERRKRSEEIVRKAKDAELPRLLFDSEFGGELRVEGYEGNRSDKGRGGLRALAKAAGVDAGAIERRFDKAKPEAAAKTPAKKATKRVTKKAARSTKKAAKKGGRR